MAFLEGWEGGDGDFSKDLGGSDGYFSRDLGRGA